jgi:hypothetical protein
MAVWGYARTVEGNILHIAIDVEVLQLLQYFCNYCNIVANFLQSLQYRVIKNSLAPNSTLGKHHISMTY